MILLSLRPLLVDMMIAMEELLLPVLHRRP